MSLHRYNRRIINDIHKFYSYFDIIFSKRHTTKLRACAKEWSRVCNGTAPASGNQNWTQATWAARWTSWVNSKVTYRNKRLLFWLPTCLGISYCTAFDLRALCAPSKQKSGYTEATQIFRHVYHICFCPGRQEPWLRHYRMEKEGRGEKRCERTVKIEKRERKRGGRKGAEMGRERRK